MEEVALELLRRGQVGLATGVRRERRCREQEQHAARPEAWTAPTDQTWRGAP